MKYKRKRIRRDFTQPPYVARKYSNTFNLVKFLNRLYKGAFKHSVIHWYDEDTLLDIYLGQGRSYFFIFTIERASLVEVRYNYKGDKTTYRQSWTFNPSLFRLMNKTIHMLEARK